MKIERPASVWLRMTKVERAPTASPTAMPPAETPTNSRLAWPRLKAPPVATPTAIR